MTTPIVTENTRRLEPVARDPFIDGLRASRGEEPDAGAGRPRSG
jgi:hypothetical protein